ncbi:MAG TPA: hypothetical protein VMU26_09055 [Candidatus Polarisedimenticolia bacterium]|jgi:hypothetical protein|nr:hypothetical protein [Candidatus Polarisedimenticolia bacterium]
MAHVDNDDEPEVIAVVPLPSAAERRRREIMLALVRLTSFLRAITRAVTENEYFFLTV